VRRLRVPAGLLVCVAVAVVNAACWAVLIPPFQVPDEPVHYAYVQYLAETGDLPKQAPAGDYSEELDAAQRLQPFSTGGDPTWLESRSRLSEQRLGEDDLDRIAPFGAGYVAGNPPLFYAMQAIPYRLAGGASLLDRMLAMRLLSALLCGLLAGFVFLFLRELMPTRPLAWRVGALGVGLHPLAGFMGGGLNPDVLQWTLCAGILWLLARAFRHGLGVRTGLAIGALAAGAMLTKLAMLTMLPGLAIALVLVAVAGPPERRRTALAGVGVAVLVTAVPFFAYQLLASVAADKTVAAGALSTTPNGRALNLREGLSYLWQFYLPPLPFMIDQFPDYPEHPVWDVFFTGFVGRFGWFAYDFPGWVNGVGLAVVVGLVGAAGVALFKAREQLAPRRRRIELAAYAIVAGLLVLLVHAAGYRYRETYGFDFEQTRYLFPLLPLYGAVLGLAAWAGGRAWARPLGALIVLVAAGHNLLALGLSLDRYYT